MKDTYRKLYYEDGIWYFESDNMDRQAWSVSSFDEGIDSSYMRRCNQSYYISYEISHETTVIDNEKF